MENLAHTLVGLAAAKAGLGRLSPGATALCMVAANAPDADVLTTYWGRWVYLHHHRGITHSITGTIALGLILPLLFYAGERIVARLRGKPPKFKPDGLLIASLVTITTHPLLDWTNNYGVRPFLPWNRQWYYGDLVFIVDPWIWLLVGGACFLLTARGWWRISLWTLLALALAYLIILLPLRNTSLPLPLTARIVWVVGVGVIFAAWRVGLGERWGRRIPRAAFLLLLAYWAGLGFMHARAVREAGQLAGEFAASRNETVKRIAAMPVLADPTLWRCVAETDGGATFLFNLDLNGKPAPLRDVVLYERPQGQEALVALASRDERARIFLDFARFPVIQTRGDCLTETFVQFADLRYTEPGRGSQGTFSLEVPVECPPEAVETQKK